MRLCIWCCKQTQSRSGFGIRVLFSAQRIILRTKASVSLDVHRIAFQLRRTPYARPAVCVEIALLDNDATKFARSRLLGIRIITTNIPSKYPFMFRSTYFSHPNNNLVTHFFTVVSANREDTQWEMRLSRENCSIH